MTRPTSKFLGNRDFHLHPLPYHEFRRMRDAAPRGVATAIVWDRFPGIRQITIQREIMERPDLSSDAKLVYGLLDFFYPVHPQLGLYEIAGLLGLGVSNVQRSVRDLEAVGLIKRSIRKERLPSGGVRSCRTRYYLTKVPHRFDEQPPAFLKTSLVHFDEQIREIFSNIDLDNLDKAEIKPRPPVGRVGRPKGAKDKAPRKCRRRNSN